jgi:BASS family bile acid:Na+ symporter
MVNRKMVNRIKKLQPYMMPVTMIAGGIFHSFFASLAVVIPWLIFAMLLITYCGLSLRDIHFSKQHLWLIMVQLFGSILVYLLVSPFNTLIAQGAMICVLAPTATSAPVIAGMLKGNVASLTAYSLISNMTVAVAAPVIFSLTGSYNTLPFFESFLMIAQRIAFLLFVPFLLAMALRQLKPEIKTAIAKHPRISFYLWNCALAIVTGRTVDFIIQQGADNYAAELIIAGCALLLCVLQFFLGRKIGRAYNDTIAGGQGLGQKNTVLAIWMAQTYLNPLSSIGPGAYVLWQNIINSCQVWRKRKNL